MSADGPDDGWTDEVIAFLSSNIPKFDDSSGWHHRFMSAYQIGCMALVELGQAYEDGPVFYQVDSPQIPKTLPRWDDVCVAVLALARQNGLINYHDKDRSMAPDRLAVKGFRVQSEHKRPEPIPNIQPKNRLGYAHAKDELLSLLLALGLTDNGLWTARAETVLWREQPKEWQLGVKADPRFENAVNYGVEKMPDHIREEIKATVKITNEDVDAAIVVIENEIKELREKHGPKARLGGSTDAKSIRKSLEFQRSSSLDWIFYRNWRLDTGWLSETEAARALDIFHDPLAQAMKHEVIAHLYPDFSSR